MNEAIITRGLVKRYGSVNALDGFSLSIPSGSITGLVGRNGAGKTTWMMTVA
jgi:ABC-2 type transport system ATP-binding protein